MLTVLTPAASSALTTRAVVRGRSAVVAAASDAQLDTLIDEASSRIAAYCQRSFGKTQVRQTVRPPYVSYSTYDPLFPGLAYREPDPIVLEAPGPVVSIDAVTVQNVATPLVENADFERDAYRLFRLFNDVRVVWAYRKIVIDFTVGYRLPGDPTPSVAPDLPGALSAACGELVARAWAASRRDQTIARETIVGVSQFDFAPFGANTTGGAKNGLPADVAAMLEPFVYRAVA
ncbi:MAG: hypothetical protein QM651_16005 [Rhodoblastus sp.]